MLISCRHHKHGWLSSIFRRSEGQCSELCCIRLFYSIHECAIRIMLIRSHLLMHAFVAILATVFLVSPAPLKALDRVIKLIIQFSMVLR